MTFARNLGWLAAGSATIGLAFAIGGPLSGQGPAQPAARYVMDVSTVSGMAAMGSGIGAGLSMAFGGGGNNVVRQLALRLGSSTPPAGGSPQADHFMPANAGLGKSVPLQSPAPSRPATPREEVPQNIQLPQGRLMIFWGCGAHAPKGQPVIIDFAKLGAGQVPPGLFSTSVPVENPGPTVASSRTYGEWPNALNSRRLAASSSLIGDHRIAGNYSPEIAFSLRQDFMPPISGKASPMADGSQMLSWNSVAGATGYYAWVMGFNPGRDGKAQDMVWWSSSARQEFGGGLSEWLSPATVSRLIGQRVVLPPSQTQCQMPVEAAKAMGQFQMGNLYAYGPEADFAHPPRPADARAPWRPIWTTKVRYRATTSFMLNGPDFGAMSRDEETSSQGRNQGRSQQQEEACKPSVGNVLGGLLGGRRPRGC